MAWLPSIPGFQQYPTVTGDDGIVQVDEELLRQMTPQQREVYDAFRDAYHLDPAAAGAMAPPAPQGGATGKGGQELAFPATPPAPGSDGRRAGAAGKEGEDKNIYKLLGTLSDDNRSIIGEDGKPIEVPAGAEWAFDPQTRDVYYIPPSNLTRGTFLPLAQHQGTGQMQLAMPQALQGGLDAIDRAAERFRRGLAVPYATLNREAMEVAGLAQTGGWGAGAIVREAEDAAGRAAARVGEAVGSPTPATAGVRLGTAGGGTPPKPSLGPARPMDLDQAGFFSQAERGAAELPATTTAQDALGILLNKHGVREAEVQALNLDKFLLGDEVANARRAMLTARDEHSALLQKARAAEKDLKEFNDMTGRSPDAHWNAEVAKLQNKARADQGRVNLHENIVRNKEGIYNRLIKGHTDLEGNVTPPFKPRKVTRDEIQQYVAQHRIRMAETTYDAPQWTQLVKDKLKQVQDYATNVQQFTKDLRARTLVGTITSREVAAEIRASLQQFGHQPEILQETLDNIASYHGPLLAQAVKQVLTAHLGTSVERLAKAPSLSGNPRLKFNKQMLEPDNPTQKGITLRIESPQAKAAVDILDTIPQPAREIVTANWGMDAAYLADHGFGSRHIQLVMDARNHYAKQIAKLKKLEQEGLFLSGHFPEQGVTGFALTSIQRLPDGRRVLLINQIQSDWTGAIEGGRTTARHALVRNIAQWADPVIRRAIREAVEQKLDGVIIPDGASVRSYNGGLPAQIADLYDKVYPIRVSKVLQEFDRASPKPEPVGPHVSYGVGPHQGLLPHEGSGQLNQTVGGWFFPLTDKAREAVRSRGLRLMSGTEDNPLGAGAAAAVSAAMRPTPIDSIGARQRHPGPVLAYHGTVRTGHEFRDMELHRDLGHHFGTREQANQVAGLLYRGDSKNLASHVIPAVLDIHRPLTLPDIGGWDPVKVHRAIRRAIGRERWEELGFDRIDEKNVSHAMNRRMLEHMGYDSVRYRNGVEGDGWSYIIWKPGQVRSATGGQRLYSSGAPVPTNNEDRDGQVVSKR